MTASEPISAGTLAEAFKHCAALARENARDQWLGALYAPAGSWDALFALACFDHEIRLARLRARDPNLAALRLAWWREAALGAGDPGAGGSPAALALRAAIAAFTLPGEAIEAMLDARLTEIAPPVDFTLAAFAIYAAESEGARLRLASRIAAGARDLDDAEASAPAGLALGLARMLAGLSSGATLFPADVAKRHGATRADFDAMRASAGRRRRLGGAARPRPRAPCRGREAAKGVAAANPSGLRPPRDAKARPRQAGAQRESDRSSRPPRYPRSAGNGRFGAGPKILRRRLKAHLDPSRRPLSPDRLSQPRCRFLHRGRGVRCRRYSRTSPIESCKSSAIRWRARSGSPSQIALKTERCW